MIIMTTRGEMDDSLLIKKTGEIDNENEHTTWVEYWLDGELVHRSVHIDLKQAIFSETGIGGFNG